MLQLPDRFQTEFGSLDHESTTLSTLCYKATFKCGTFKKCIMEFLLLTRFQRENLNMWAFVLYYNNYKTVFSVRCILSCLDIEMIRLKYEHLGE